MKDKAILFDCDGVLVDSEVIYIETELKHLADFGLSYDRDDYQARFSGLSGSNFVRRLELDMRKQGKIFDFNEFNLRVHPDIERRFEQELKAVDGLLDFMEQFEQPCAVASSSGMERLQWKLKKVAAHHFFDPHIYSGEQVANGKPAPDLFLFAANQLNFEPGNCIVIEDSENGVRAGVAASMTVWGFAGGSHMSDNVIKRLKNAGAERIIESYDDLARALKP